MKKTKLFVRYVVAGAVALTLSIALILSFTAANADLPDDQVEELALELKLVSVDEAVYPSIAEMEERLQKYNAGAAFTDISVRLSIIMVIAIIAVTIGLSLFKLAQNKQKLIRFSIPAGGLLLVLIFSRIFASGSSEGINTAVTVTEGQLINVSTLINATLLLLVISFTALGTYRIKHILTK